jgi:hypothetical protein
MVREKKEVSRVGKGRERIKRGERELGENGEEQEARKWRRDLRER